jgi:hypothetical protein
MLLFLTLQRLKMLIDPLRTEFYKVEYVYQDKTHYACYFNLESAQEAMMKMISRGVTVNGLHTHKPLPQIIGTVRKASQHHTKPPQHPLQ